MSVEQKLNGYKKLATGIVKTDFSFEKKNEILKMIEASVSKDWHEGVINYKENRDVVEYLFNVRTVILKQKAALRYAA